MFVKDLFLLFVFIELKFIAYNVEIHRNQEHIQKHCGFPHEALCNFLSLLIAAKSSILNMVEFQDLSLKTSPCMKTSWVLCENQSFLKCGHLFQNSLCFSITFYSMMKSFWSAFQTVAYTILFLWIQSVVQSQNYL